MSRKIDKPASAPEWIRLPAEGERERYTNVTRSVIWRLVKAGVVDSRLLQTPGSPGAKRGTRLIRLSSLLAAIENSPSAHE